MTRSPNCSQTMWYNHEQFNLSKNGPDPMQQTDFTFEINGDKIKTLDADGNGQFIALTETGLVIAHDFKAMLKRVRHRPPLEFRYPMIRRLDPNRFLVVNARTRGENNGRVFDLDGQELNCFFLGDAIEDILIFPDRNRIAIMYHEVGIIGSKPPSGSGVAVFSHDGKQLWGFNDLIDKGDISENALIIDRLPLCKNGTDSILFFSHYFKSQLTELRLDDFNLSFSAIPERVHFATALSPIGENEIIFYQPDTYRPEPDSEKFFWWDRQTNDVEELSGPVSGWITGLGNGRFLCWHDFGYTVIDPLA
ncbi:MAG: hypothetical protein FWH27_15550 [Planctomycetaceae bacterium]|nr:hypothetical protein [Planctomycetaceae bacterium]